MKLLQLNSEIGDFKSELEKIKNQEEKLQQDTEIAKKENDEVNKRYKSISKSKKSQDSDAKAEDDSKLARLFIFSLILAIVVWVIIGYIGYIGWGLICGFVSFWIPPFIHGMKEGTKPQKEKSSVDQKYSSTKKEKSKSDKKVSGLTEELNYVQSNIEVLQKNIKSNNSIISFNQIYDIDDNGLLDIAESTNIEKIIKNKQKEIREIEKKENRDYLKDFSKISLFLNSFQSQLVSDYEDIQNSGNDFDSINSKIKYFDQDYRLYKTFLSSMILMVSYVVNDNTLDFYKLRELFDKLSVFESNFEKNLLGELRGLTKVTSELINITLESRDEIMSELSLLDSSISDVEFELQYLTEK